MSNTSWCKGEAGREFRPDVDCEVPGVPLANVTLGVLAGAPFKSGDRADSELDRAEGGAKTAGSDMEALSRNSRQCPLHSSSPSGAHLSHFVYSEIPCHSVPDCLRHCVVSDTEASGLVACECPFRSILDKGCCNYDTGRYGDVLKKGGEVSKIEGEDNYIWYRYRHGLFEEGATPDTLSAQSKFHPPRSPDNALPDHWRFDFSSIITLHSTLLQIQ